MGQYNQAVLTTAGQALLTSILGSQGTLTFSKFQTSSYQYASGTDLSALTSLQSVEQTVTPSAGGITDATTFYSSSTVSNSGVTTEYNCYTVGLFASDGVNEVLFAVSTAITPDVIPVDDGGTPSTYTYTISIIVSSTADITVEVPSSSYLTVDSIVDNLTSTSATQPLSANQGRILNGIIAVYEISPAVAHHNVGDYVKYAGKTYEVTQEIQIGNTLTVGTNIAVPTLPEGTIIKTPADNSSAVINALQSDIVTINAALGSTDISGIGDGTVTGAIGMLNSNLTPSTLSYSNVVNSVPEGSYNSFGGIKYGKLIILNMFVYGGDWEVGDVVFTLKDAYKPKFALEQCCYAGVRFGQWYPCKISIDTSGNVKVYFQNTGITSVGEVQISLVYCTN